MPCRHAHDACRQPSCRHLCHDGPFYLLPASPPCRRRPTAATRPGCSMRHRPGRSPSPSFVALKGLPGRHYADICQYAGFLILRVLGPPPPAIFYASTPPPESPHASFLPAPRAITSVTQRRFSLRRDSRRRDIWAEAPAAAFAG